MNEPIKSLKISNAQWAAIMPKMVEHHGPSINISWVQRRKLGFVVRSAQYHIDGYYLDFWEEKYKTAFILRYL